MEQYGRSSVATSVLCKQSVIVLIIYSLQCTRILFDIFFLMWRELSILRQRPHNSYFAVFSSFFSVICLFPIHCFVQHQVLYGFMNDSNFTHICPSLDLLSALQNIVGLLCSFYIIIIGMEFLH